MSKHTFLVIAFIAAALFAGCRMESFMPHSNYYIDLQHGDDNSNGKSPRKAWKTLERLNTAKFSPGDKILLNGGQEFSGSIRLNDLKGNAENPVIISSYGNGKAVINSADSAALVIRNSHYVTCRNLILSGSGRLTGNITDGILFDEVEHGIIDSIEVSGYLFSGIHVKGGSNITITNCHAHDNGFSGIFTESGKEAYGEDGSIYKTLRNVYIAHSVASNNPGCPAITNNHSGNGILIAGVIQGTIEYCEAFGNGWDMPREGNGPVGIWAYMSDSIIIQHCYSHHNKTSARGKDGGGFDFDGGIRNSIMQYNFSAFNEGAGYGIFQYAGATLWTDNIIRYNVSYFDGSKNGQSGIFMWCDPVALAMRDFHAYNNTIVTSDHGVAFEPGHYEGFVFENNIFLIKGKTSEFITGNFTGAEFIHNCYWSDSKPVRVDPDLSPVVSDPLLHSVDAVELQSLNPELLTEIDWFIPGVKSPCLNAGNIITANGGIDFRGMMVPKNALPTIGAFQEP